MNVVVLGLGYIGLPTASMLAQAGHRVIGVDVNTRLLEMIRSGCGHIAEVEVRSLVCSALTDGTLCVSSSLPDFADAYLICVPTPTTEYKPDLSYVESAANSIASRVRDGDLIVLESTVPPGTVENTIVRILESAGKSPDHLHITHCPERVIPGNIVYELRHNARVIGGRRPIDAEAAKTLYASFSDGEICVTDCLTAELVKVVENTYRDVNLAFANELAMLSEVLGVNAWEVIALANKHPRVDVLRPGPGVGGHCIPVDPHFLSAANPFSTELIQTARRVNERMPHFVGRLVDSMLSPFQKDSKIAILGASYKANIDDTRESPSWAIVQFLREHRYRVAVYDPLAKEFPYPLSATIQDAASDADAVVLVTDHEAFRQIEPKRLGQLMRRRVLIDTRHFLNYDAWESAGFAIRTLGVSPQSRLDVQSSRTA